MTKRQRELIVECLRCACDSDSLAAMTFEFSPKIYNNARKAWEDLQSKLEWTPDTFRFTWLEVAALVEEGSWP